ncbi:MAG: MG2 domain-containing protein [bacterium]
MSKTNSSQSPKNQDDNDSKNDHSKSKFLFLKYPYYIIAVLLAIILVGLLYVLFSGRGRETVQVTAFTPEGEVQQTTNFTVEFSKNLAPDSLLNVQLDGAFIEFKPPLPGQYRWIEKNKLRFYPDVQLAPSTAYRAEVSSRVATDYGYSLAGAREFLFYTTRFQVNSAILTFEYTPESFETVKLLSTIEFNYDVDPLEAQRSIALLNKAGKSLPFTLQTTAPDRILRLEAENIERGEDKKEIRLKIAQGLLCLGGNLGLERDFIKPMILPGQMDLKVERMLPKKSAPSKGFVQIQFNLPINIQNGGQFIRVQPPIKYQITASHRYLELKGDFKMGSTYQVSIRKGLQAVDGSPLERDFSSAVTFRREQIPPQIDFVGEGFYLTRSGKLNLGLSTINVNKVNFEVEKIYANNLAYLLNRNDLSQKWASYNLRTLGRRIHQSDLVVQSVENEEVVTPINVKEYLAGERLGIFKLTARLSEQRWRHASKWVIATDMGLLTKKAGDDLWVWVNSLSMLEPVTGAEITLISQNNQILMSAKTNQDGIAVFENYTRYTEDFVPYLITASLGNDFSFLELHRRRIPTSDFDVGGAAYLQHGYEAFMYNERGVYRPGEHAHLAAVVRGENISVPTAFPVKLQVKGPDGKILTEQKSRLNEAGAAEFDVAVPEFAMTGGYLARLFIGDKQEIGRTSFNVEEFIPDRMKVKLSTNRKEYSAGMEMQINVEAVTLFGPPAAGRQVEAELQIEPFVYSPPDWQSFTFYDLSKSYSTVKINLGARTLDASGQHTYTHQILKNLNPPSALRAVIYTTVLEPGGRGVSANKGVLIHPHETYVGMRKTQEGYAKPEEETEFDYVVLNQENQLLAQRSVEISLYRIYWHSILKRVDSRRGYRYVSEKVEELQHKFTTTSEAKINRFSVTPDQYGRYRVLIRDLASGASTSLSFYSSGWGYSPWAMAHPDRIELDLDKEVYSPGEKARIQIRAPFAGKLLLTLEREKIFDSYVLNLKENTAEFEIPVTDMYKPNAYISAHLIRSTETLERDTPARAFGVIPLKVNTEENRLSVKLDVPDEIRPRSQLEIKIKIGGHENRQPYVTVAAVDEGICQLTDFQTPDAHQFFFGKKRLSVESYDIYGVVLPEIESTLSSVSGDLEARRKTHLTPVSVTRVKPVAFWSGLVQCDDDGRGEIRFDIPQFNGSVRLMAVAFAGDKFGHQQKNVFVREPIVLTPTFPRFISSRDEFTVPVSVFNGAGKEAQIEVTLQTEGPVQVLESQPQQLTIAPNQEKLAYFKIRAGENTGRVKFRVAARGGGEQTDMEVEVPLRPPVPFVTVSGNGAVEENKPASFEFPSNWVAGTTDFKLTLSSFPAVNFAHSLQYLLRYPHGCVEQTTSKLFPLLYFNEIARLAEPELFNRNSADYFIDEGIARLESMQLVSGAFSYWPTGNYINNWSSIYAAHFLVEARKAGYAVSDRVYDRLIDALQNFTRNYHTRDRYSYQTAVYACYVLALAGKPDKSTMLYLKNSLLDKLNHYSKFQLAGAFALTGDLQTALTMLPKSVISVKTEKRETGRNFNSPVRSQAIMLDVLAEVDEKHPMVPVLVENLINAAAKRGRWYSTQENAFAFLALGKIMSKQPDANYTGSVDIDGEVYSTFDTDNKILSGKDWAGKNVTVTIKGTGACYYYWRVDGIPAKLTIDEYDNDLMVRRRYLDENGNAIHYNNFQQGEMVIAEISVKALNESLQNVAIVDMLPAGLEIENPRLQSRKGIDWIGNRAYRPMYMDIRDDRLILYGDFRFGQSVKFYYGLRAVTQGSFILPPIRAEAMYAPDKASVASSGSITVNSL